MNWTEQKPPTEGVSFYDHVSLETPLGLIMIEWKSWKDSPSYDIMIDGNWLGVEYDLGTAKCKAIQFLKSKLDELNKFLKP